MKKSTFKFMSALMIVMMLMTVVLALPANAEDLPTTLYVTKINQVIGTADGNIFTKAFKNSDKVKSDPATGGNFVWAAVIAAEPTGNANEFKVTYSKKFIEDKEEEVTIPNGGFIYAAHCDDANKESDIYKKSSANQLATAALKVGDIIKLTDIDIAKSTLGANPAITIVSTSGGTTSQGTSSAASSVATSSTTASGTSSVTSAASSASTSSTAASSAAASSQTNSTTSAASSTGSNAEVEESSNTALYIGIAAGVIVIIAVVAVILAKKKKA